MEDFLVSFWDLAYFQVRLLLVLGRVDFAKNIPIKNWATNLTPKGWLFRSALGEIRIYIALRHAGMAVPL